MSTGYSSSSQKGKQGSTCSKGTLNYNRWLYIISLKRKEVNITRTVIIADSMFHDTLTSAAYQPLFEQYGDMPEVLLPTRLHPWQHSQQVPI